MNVTDETAQLAKEKGFSEQCAKIVYISENGHRMEANASYDLVNGHYIDMLRLLYKFPKQTFCVPTQAQLQTWLRNVHNIRVFVTEGDNNHNYSGYILFDFHQDGSLFKTKSILVYENYEDALENLLNQALQLVR